MENEQLIWQTLVARQREVVRATRRKESHTNGSSPSSPNTEGNTPIRRNRRRKSFRWKLPYARSHDKSSLSRKLPAIEYTEWLNEKRTKGHRCPYCDHVRVRQDAASSMMATRFGAAWNVGGRSSLEIWHMSVEINGWSFCVAS